MAKISVSNLLQITPDEYIKGVGEAVNVDKSVKKILGNYFFKLLLFSTLENERLSLRDIAANSHSPLFKGINPGVLDEIVGWTGVRDRLINIKLEFFEKIYSHLLDKVEELYGVKKLSKFHIKRYDSTMIKVFAHLLKGMKVGNTSKNKNQAKVTTEYKDAYAIKFKFHKDQAHLSEETALKEMIQDSPNALNDIVVFDNGLKSRKTFREFDDDGIKFVTNIGSHPRYQLIHPHQPLDIDDENLEFLQDSKVLLYESGQSKPNEHEFRLVEFKVKKTGKHLFILTNILNLSASEIALCYQFRWDIEVLFRFLKQEMAFTHFVSNDLNAIQVMIYMKLIAAILILIYKKENEITTYKRAKREFFNELCLTIILDLVEDPITREWFITNAKKFVKRE